MADLQSLTINDTGYLGLPQGTTAQRPSSPAVGYTRFNDLLGMPEYYNGNAWKPIATPEKATNEIFNYQGAGGYTLFDGSSNITFSDPGINQYNWTIETIIYPINISNAPMFISPRSSGFDHFLRFLTTGQVRFQITQAGDLNNRSYDTVSSAPLNQYSHVVFSRTSSTVLGYFNGEEEFNISDTIPSAVWSGTLYVGSRANNTFYYNGRIALIRIYNRVLTSIEVIKNFYAYNEIYGIL